MCRDSLVVDVGGFREHRGRFYLGRGSSPCLRVGGRCGRFRFGVDVALGASGDGVCVLFLSGLAGRLGGDLVVLFYVLRVGVVF